MLFSFSCLVQFLNHALTSSFVPSHASLAAILLIFSFDPFLSMIIKSVVFIPLPAHEPMREWVLQWFRYINLWATCLMVFIILTKSMSVSAQWNPDDLVLLLLCFFTQHFIVWSQANDHVWHCFQSFICILCFNESSHRIDNNAICTPKTVWLVVFLMSLTFQLDIVPNSCPLSLTVVPLHRS